MNMTFPYNAVIGKHDSHLHHYEMITRVIRERVALSI